MLKNESLFWNSKLGCFRLDLGSLLEKSDSYIYSKRVKNSLLWVEFHSLVIFNHYESAVWVPCRELYLATQNRLKFTRK